MALSFPNGFPITFCFRCWLEHGDKCVFMNNSTNLEQQSMQYTVPQQHSEAIGKPEKKRGRPKNSKDKVPRNRKGEGLAKKATWAKSGRPSKGQKHALDEMKKLKNQIDHEKLFGISNPELYTQLQQLKDQAGLAL